MITTYTGRHADSSVGIAHAVPGFHPPLGDEVLVEPAPRPRPWPAEKKKRRKRLFQEIEFINPSQGTRERHVLSDEELTQMLGAVGDDDVFLALALSEQ